MYVFRVSSLQIRPVSYIRVVAIAHAQAPLWFRAEKDGKSRIILNRNNFPVITWDSYVDIREETRVFIKEKAQFFFF